MSEWKNKSTNEGWVKNKWTHNYSKHSNETFKHLFNVVVNNKRKKRKEEEWTFKRNKTNGCGLFSV